MIAQSTPWLLLLLLSIAAAFQTVLPVHLNVVGQHYRKNSRYHTTTIEYVCSHNDEKKHSPTQQRNKNHRFRVPPQYALRRPNDGKNEDEGKGVLMMIPNNHPIEAKIKHGDNSNGSAPDDDDAATNNGASINEHEEDKSRSSEDTCNAEITVESDNNTNLNQVKIVAPGDGKLPLPSSLMSNSSKAITSAPLQYNILQALDSIYQQQSRLEILKSNNNFKSNNQAHCSERRQLQLIRKSLSDSGFELLNQRDLDLCNALNAGYLLGLSLDSELNALDASIADDFFSDSASTCNDDTVAVESKSTEEEQLSTNGSTAVNQNETVAAQSTSTSTSTQNNKQLTITPSSQQLLFDGKVLIFRRGYGQERTDERLIVPKIDYLQANIVQRGTVAVTNVMESGLERVTTATANMLNGAKMTIRTLVLELTRSLPDVLARLMLNSEEVIDFLEHTTQSDVNEGERNTSNDKVIKLLRYGGGTSRSYAPDLGDRLNPFLLYPHDDGKNATATTSTAIGSTSLTSIPKCEYDEASRETIPQSVRLLDRVSIENIFSPGLKKRGIVRRLFSKSDLVEPTYEEVVVIWRPAPPRKPRNIKNIGLTLPKPTVPKMVRNVAEIFDMEYVLPPIEPPPPPPELLPFETRVFERVAMANICAVLPKTKLVFRPADALRIDSVSGLTLIAILANQKFDNPRLDLIALVSVSLWILRTFFRYSNKLARYDLLVKKFLTSKIAQKNTGAVRYITAEGGTQRARRAALVYSWMRTEKLERGGTLTLQNVVDGAGAGIEKMIGAIEEDIKIDVKAALIDLEESNLIRIESLSEGTIEFAENGMGRLREQWINLFDAELGGMFSDTSNSSLNGISKYGESLGDRRADGNEIINNQW